MKNTNFNRNLILVNSTNPIDYNKFKVQLDKINGTEIYLDKTALANLEKVLDGIGGKDQIVAVSGYRPHEEQISIYQDSLIENGEEFTKKYVALPGHSEHETGLAIDLGLKLDEIDFIRPYFPYEGICQEFRESAIEYGFIERYPEDKVSITKIAHEPWHFRYVGLPHSKIMAEKNFCLEEYIEYLSSK